MYNGNSRALTNFSNVTETYHFEPDTAKIAKICCEQKTAEFTIQSRLSRMEKFPVYALIKLDNQKSLVCPQNERTSDWKFWRILEHYTKNPRKTNCNLFKTVHDSIKFGRRAFFCFEMNKFKIFEKKFAKSRFHLRRHHNSGLRAPDFRGVCFEHRSNHWELAK